MKLRYLMTKKQRLLTTKKRNQFHGISESSRYIAGHISDAVQRTPIIASDHQCRYVKGEKLLSVVDVDRDYCSGDGTILI